MRILAINPGSTSTKVAVFDRLDPVLELSVAHSSDELRPFANVMAQFEFRMKMVTGALAAAGIDLESIDAVIGRGGLIKPIKSGIYEVNEALRGDLLGGIRGEHASNLGGLIAESIARRIGVKAYIADPVVVDEMQPVARLTGIPGIERASIFHALNQKAIAREYAASRGRRYEEMNLVVAHLGGGISVGAHRLGEVIDVNNALDGDGPFSPERAGSIPSGALAALCFGGSHTYEEVQKMLCGRGGMTALLGTNSMKEALGMAASGDRRAQLVVDALCYNVGKAIGSMAVALEGRTDAIILTGGIAHNACICDYISRMVSFIAPVEVRPGENELLALAANVVGVTEGTLPLMVYK